MHCLFNITILCLLFGIAYGSLDTVLRRYDLVKTATTRRKVVKRNAANPLGRVDELQFSAFDRDFHLILKPKRGLLDAKFEAVIMGTDNQIADRLHVDRNEFMEGRVIGEPESRVTANIDEDGAINALIMLANEAYTVEPAWRYFEDMPMNMSLIYRHSDLILPRQGTQQEGSRICPEAVADSLNQPPSIDLTYWWSSVQNDSNAFVSNKVKRQTFGHFMMQHGEPPVALPLRTREKNRCSLKLVADYRFFENIGRKKASLTSRYLINLIDRVNTIYTGTVWRDSEAQSGITNYGFVIKKILILSSPAKEMDHYNSDSSGAWTVERLLQKFSEVEGSRQFCLVHLFTYQSFANGVLGLGYIASAKEGSSGGICSAPIVDKNRFYYYNTALSSAKSSSGGPVVTREADIVTAHEFGHNWGSPHDTSSLECSPPSRDGGSYIMYTYSVSGFDDNNKRFSPCSTRTIKAVLDAKAHLCFQEEETSLCGNHRVELGEECDEGLLEDPDSGRCCTANCTLKRNAVCSPRNSLCCTVDCQFERPINVCRDGDKNRCLKPAYCTGISADCPRSSPLNDGTECLDRGECQNGTCVSFCEKREIGMKPCICENMTETCYRCCRKTNSSECVPYLSSKRPLIVSNGTRCIHGHCYEGRCIREAADFVQHLWRIIDKLDINSFWKFLSDNIVGTIIIASLIVWIPGSCIVHRYDERARKTCHDNLDFIVSNYLVTGNDADRVTVVQGVKSVSGQDRDSPPSVAV